MIPWGSREKNSTDKKVTLCLGGFLRRKKHQKMFVAQTKPFLWKKGFFANRTNGTTLNRFEGQRNSLNAGGLEEEEENMNGAV